MYNCWRSIFILVQEYLSFVNKLEELFWRKEKIKPRVLSFFKEGKLGFNLQIFS